MSEMSHYFFGCEYDAYDLPTHIVRVHTTHCARVILTLCLYLSLSLSFSLSLSLSLSLVAHEVRSNVCV